MTDKLHLQDDSDMKIVAGPGEKTVSWEDEVNKTLEEMKNIREQGLLLQAQQVGAHMATFITHMNAKTTDKALWNQQLWLCVFAVTVGCESCVHNPTAARAVLNAFHDRFRVSCPDAYEDSGYSIAMSFYYLAVRNVGDSRDEIGRTFAMLCNNEGDLALRELGKETFDRCLACMDSLSGPLNGEN